MKEGIEYSKSKKLRIRKIRGMYYVEQAIGKAWIPCPNGPWDFLNNARSDMERLERILC